MGDRHLRTHLIQTDPNEKTYRCRYFLLVRAQDVVASTLAAVTLAVVLVRFLLPEPHFHVERLLPSLRSVPWPDALNDLLTSLLSLCDDDFLFLLLLYQVI